MWIDRRVLLFGGATSLLLNVFLLGIFIGHGFEGRGARRGQPRGGGLIKAVHVRALPPEERQSFAAAMAPHRPAIRSAREMQRAARMAVEADISAPAFDRGRLAADFAVLRKANDAVGEAVDAALADALSNLPPPARAALVSHVGRPAAEAP